VTQSRNPMHAHRRAGRASPRQTSCAASASTSAPAAPSAPDVGAWLSGLFGGGKAKKEEQRKEAKYALLDAIVGTERGVKASAQDAAAIEAAACNLERLNPNAKALSCDLLNGEWELLYTTSKSIIGATRPWPFRPLGPIYQTIDTGRLRANNRETFPFYNGVDADLTPTSAAAVNVQFVTFLIFGLLPVTAPATARGTLAVSYLDEDLRVSRGNMGNLFVLRMSSPEKRLVRKGDTAE